MPMIHNCMITAVCVTRLYSLSDWQPASVIWPSLLLPQCCASSTVEHVENGTNLVWYTLLVGSNTFWTPFALCRFICHSELWSLKSWHSIWQWAFHEKHINKVVVSCFYHQRWLRQHRCYIDQEVMTQLVMSFLILTTVMQSSPAYQHQQLSLCNEYGTPPLDSYSSDIKLTL